MSLESRFLDILHEGQAARQGSAAASALGDESLADSFASIARTCNARLKLIATNCPSIAAKYYPDGVPGRSAHK